MNQLCECSFGDRKGGRGKCRYCRQMIGNVSFHEAHECPMRPGFPESKIVTQLDCVGVDGCKASVETIKLMT